MEKNRQLEDLSKQEVEEIWNLWKYQTMKISHSSICKRFNISMETLKEAQEKRAELTGYKKRRRRLNNEEKQEIKDLFLSGESATMVARKMNIAYDTARIYKYKFSEEKKGKVVLTPEQRRKLIILVGKGFSSEDIAAHFGISLERLEAIKKTQIKIK